MSEHLWPVIVVTKQGERIPAEIISKRPLPREDQHQTFRSAMASTISSIRWEFCAVTRDGGTLEFRRPGTSTNIRIDRDNIAYIEFNK